MDNFRVDLVPNCDPYSGREDRGSKKRPKHNPEPTDEQADEVILSSAEGDAGAEPPTYSPPRRDSQE